MRDEGCQVASRLPNQLSPLALERTMVSATIDACTTRPRLVVRDHAAVDEAALKRLSARGLLRPGLRDLQVVIGPTADQLAREMRGVNALLSARSEPLAAPPLHVHASDEQATAPPEAALAIALALEGRANASEPLVRAGRMIVTLADPARVDPVALAAATRGAVEVGPGRWHLLVDPAAAAVIARALRPG